MRIAVLGPLLVQTGASVPLTVPGATERLLLAALASGAPGVVPADDLLGLLPAGSDEDVLREHLGRLRRALEPGLPERSSGQYVLRRGAGYVLALGSSDLDVTRFEGLVRRGRAALAAADPAEAVAQLRDALALWRGEPYADWPTAAFAATARRRLVGLHAGALAALEQATAEVRTSPARPAVGAVARPVHRPPEPCPVEAPPAEDPALAPAVAVPEDDALEHDAPGDDAPEAEFLAGHGRSSGASSSRTRRAVLAGSLVAALVVTALAVRSRQDPADAPPTTAETLADRAGRIVARQDPLDISLLLAVAAVRIEDTPESRGRLLDAVGRLGRVQRVAPFTGIPVDPVLSGGEVLTFRNDRTVLGWTAGRGTQPRVLIPVPGEWGAWTVTAPSPIEPLVVTAGESLGGGWLRTVSAVDGTSRLLAAGDELGGRPVEAAVTSDGRRVRLLLEDPSDAIRWRVVEVDLADGAVRDTGVAGVIPAVADALAGDFSDDAATLVVWDVTRAAPATLVDLRTGSRSEVATPPDPAADTGFQALPSGALRLRDDGTVSLVDGGGRGVQELEAHDGQVRDALLAPGGGWAVTAGDGSEVVRWDVDAATGTWSRPQSLTGHAGSVVGVETDAAGSTLYTVSLDNRVIAWDMRERGGLRQDRARRLPTMDVAAQLAEACAVVGRDLTPAEWRTYLPGQEFRTTCSDLP